MSHRTKRPCLNVGGGDSKKAARGVLGAPAAALPQDDSAASHDSDKERGSARPSVLDQSLLKQFSGPAYDDILSRMVCEGRVDNYHAPVGVRVEVEDEKHPGCVRTEVSPMYIATPSLTVMNCGAGYPEKRQDGSIRKITYSLKLTCPLPEDGSKETGVSVMKTGLERMVRRIEDLTHKRSLEIFGKLGMDREDVRLGKLIDWRGDDAAKHEFPPTLVFKIETKGKGPNAQPDIAVFDSFKRQIDWFDIHTGDTVRVIGSPVVWIFQGTMGLSLVATQIQVCRAVQHLRDRVELDDAE